MTFEDVQIKVNDLYHDSDSSAGDYISLEKSLQDIKDQIPPYFRKIRAAFLSSFTIQGLPQVFRARGIFHNLWADLYESPYNQFTQEILNKESGLYQFKPQIVYLLIDHKDLLNERHLEEILEEIEEKTEAKIIIFNFASLDDIDNARIKNKNDYLNNYSKNHNRVFVFDFAAFLEGAGKEKYWYTKYKDLGDLRISPQAFPILAEPLLGYSTAFAGNAKKCLVLDLDNTLWKGIVGEDGIEKIEPDKNLQEYILSLYKSGIVLAINSMNNEEDAFLALEKHPDMILRRDHFAAWRVNWNSKAQNISELAQELNLGLDSFVFVDDDPFQRNAVKNSFPEVAVMHPDMLRQFSGFYSFNITEEDLRRGAMYVEERKRKELKGSIKNTDDYLRRLNLEIFVEAASEKNIPRLSQLTQKTNQFNLTTRRYSEEELKRFMDSGWKIWGMEARDAFGDYGLAGVSVVNPAQSEWKIDTFLLSCRVLGRGIEQAFFGHIYHQAKKAGAKKIVGEYIPTAKNKPCESFLPDQKFSLIKKEGNSHIYEFDLKKDYKYPEFIKIT